MWRTWLHAEGKLELCPHAIAVQLFRHCQKPLECDPPIRATSLGLEDSRRVGPLPQQKALKGQRVRGQWSDSEKTAKDSERTVEQQ